MGVSAGWSRKVEEPKIFNLISVSLMRGTFVSTSLTVEISFVTVYPPFPLGTWEPSVSAALAHSLTLGTLITGSNCLTIEWTAAGWQLNVSLAAEGKVECAQCYAAFDCLLHPAQDMQEQAWGPRGGESGGRKTGTTVWTTRATTSQKWQLAETPCSLVLEEHT